MKQLLHNPQVTEIIHAGDAGREGELIVRNIINLCNVNVQKADEASLDFIFNETSYLSRI